MICGYHLIKSILGWLTHSIDRETWCYSPIGTIVWTSKRMIQFYVAVLKFYHFQSEMTIRIIIPSILINIYLVINTFHSIQTAKCSILCMVQKQTDSCMQLRNMSRKHQRIFLNFFSLHNLSDVQEVQILFFSNKTQRLFLN